MKQGVGTRDVRSKVVSERVRDRVRERVRDRAMEKGRVGRKMKD